MPLLRTVRTTLILAAGVLAVAACHPPLHGPWPSVPTHASEYHIGPGDILRVNVWQNQELSTRVTVRPDGAVTLPLIDEVPVAGRTVAQANDEIAQRYRRFIAAENHVTVSVEEIHSYRVYVLGRVNHPGEFEARTPVTVLQALALAGGPTRLADPDRIVVLHHQDEVTRRYLFSYDEATAGRLEQNFTLATGDTLVVP
jgi:polysaccharide export outer membrane protein